MKQHCKRKTQKRNKFDIGAGCADAVDVGETSYSMVLADDLNGDGKLDLVVTTMNGNVYVFGSPARYHPLKSWTSQVSAGWDSAQAFSDRRPQNTACGVFVHASNLMLARPKHNEANRRQAAVLRWCQAGPLAFKWHGGLPRLSHMAQ